MKTNYRDIDEYLIDQPVKFRKELQKLRKTIKSVVPEAIEVISYGMPAFKYHGMLVGFAGFKAHCSFFPWNNSTVVEFQKELSTFTTSKGTIRFTVEEPLPNSLIVKIVKFRIKQNLMKEELKKVKAPPKKSSK